MSEEQLNIEYIREKTGLVENDELIPIILKMIKDSYKAGLCQAEYDNTMDSIEERQEVIDYLKEKINYLNNIKDGILTLEATGRLNAYRVILSKIEKSDK